METAWLGVKEFHPDVVHILYSDAVADAYEPMLKMLPSSVTAHEYRIDPYASQKIMEICDGIHSFLHEGDRLMYNLTEGTKVAAAAAYSVAARYSDKAVYYSQEGEMIDLLTWERRPINVRVSNKEFLDLFGNDLESYNRADEILPVDVVTAYEVKRFIENEPRLFERMQKSFRRDFGGRLENLPERFFLEKPNRVELSIKDGGLVIRHKSKVVFNSDNPLATRLFFTGRWWEVIVSDKVLKWDLSRRSNRLSSEVWRNVEFKVPGTGKTKNELDIMVNEGIRLLFIECKSGYIGQENIYKIYSTKVTYGGDHSMGILVSYYPLDKALKDKCDDLHINYFAPEKDADRIKYIDKLPSWLDGVSMKMEL